MAPQYYLESFSTARDAKTLWLSDWLLRGTLAIFARESCEKLSAHAQSDIWPLPQSKVAECQCQLGRWVLYGIQWPFCYLPTLNMFENQHHSFLQLRKRPLNLFKVGCRAIQLSNEAVVQLIMTHLADCWCDKKDRVKWNRAQGCNRATWMTWR